MSVYRTIGPTLVVILVTCKNKEDLIKNEGARVLTSLCGIPPKFKLIQAFMVVLVTCHNENDPIKNEGANVLTTIYFPIIRL